MPTRPTNDEQLRVLVQQRYTQSIAQIGEQQDGTGQNQGGCCGSGCCSTTGNDPITSDLYSATELA
ncbi:MAG: hypothetical protein J2P36_36945, partial [Ktedonobacteraceae bacterium]|nr:hypothetical protein [Ktedonobacteraceae bacterium]